MMFSYRLVRLIESHADALAAGLEERVQDNSQISHFRDVPAHEMRERVYEIYRHLGEWLLGENEQAIVLTKENLSEFLKSEAVMDRAVEIMGELELLQMLEMFFDRAIYYAVIGYEEAVARAAREEGAVRAL